MKPKHFQRKLAGLFTRAALNRIAKSRARKHIWTTKTSC